MCKIHHYSALLKDVMVFEEGYSIIYIDNEFGIGVEQQNILVSTPKTGQRCALSQEKHLSRLRIKTSNCTRF